MKYFIIFTICVHRILSFTTIYLCILLVSSLYGIKSKDQTFQQVYVLKLLRTIDTCSLTCYSKNPNIFYKGPCDNRAEGSYKPQFYCHFHYTLLHEDLFYLTSFFSMNSILKHTNCIFCVLQYICTETVHRWCYKSPLPKKR